MSDFDFSTLITDRSQSDVDGLLSLMAKGAENWTDEEKSEFNLARNKGAYNYTDLNRVISAMDDINDRLVRYGYNTGYRRIEIPRQKSGRLPNGYTELEYVQSDGAQYIDTEFAPNGNAVESGPVEELDPYLWYEQDIPTASTMGIYISNVKNLKNSLTLPENVPKTPDSMGGLTQVEANNIEMILEIINTYLVSMQKILLRSGMVWAVSGGPNFYFMN